MTVTIETDYGTFQGETVSQARKQARAAEVRANRQREAEARAYGEARGAAERNGFAIYQQVRGHRGWILALPHAVVGVTVEALDGSLGGHRATYLGAAEYFHHGYEVVAVIADVCGWGRGVITRDLRSGEETVLAFGVSDGILALERLHLPAQEVRDAFDLVET